MSKEILIQVKVSGKGIASVITKNGFDDTASSSLEVIGILQNLLTIEQEKLKTVLKAQQPI
uniref:Uncharacterized protein n=1 Tax=candidate division CPR3 bacterium TaxID=2268181 RepID=A0A7C5YUY2_UNCC3